MWPWIQFEDDILLVRPPNGHLGARALDVSHTSRVALRESPIEMLLVFKVSAKAWSVADKLPTCLLDKKLLKHHSSIVIGTQEKVVFILSSCNMHKRRP
jgi:hypothetical protein